MCKLNVHLLMIDVFTKKKIKKSNNLVSTTIHLDKKILKTLTAYNLTLIIVSILFIIFIIIIIIIIISLLSISL